MTLTMVTKCAGALRAALAATVLAAMFLCAGGCAGLSMTSEELRLLESATADARFVDRSWDDLGEAERREFVRENALRWQAFDALAHGRPGTATDEQ